MIQALDVDRAEPWLYWTVTASVGGFLARAQHIRELADAARIVESSRTILFRFAPEEHVPLIYVSANIKRLGYRAEDLLASPELWQQAVHPDDKAGVMADASNLLKGLGDYRERKFRWVKPDGSFVWVDSYLIAVRDSAHRLVALEGTIIDIGESKAAEDRIVELSRTDFLTTLPNRAAFIEQLGNAFAAAKRGGTPFAVLYLDLDYFKDVNDTLGHPMGDKLLQAVAERLRNQVRESDIVARFGGDEFAVLQAGAAAPAEAGTLAAKICKELSGPYQIEGNNIRVSASIGISIFDVALLDPADMIAQADLALYRAKDAGRNQYTFHSEELDRLVRERVSLSEDLHTALERGGELEVDYQPQVEIISGRIVGMEALVRWNHPTRGRLMPADFISVTERTGAIKALGRWVLDQSCRQMKYWRDEGIAPPTIAVNISATQFKIDQEFEKEFAEILAKWDLPASDIELELTESVLLEVTLEHRVFLEHLRQSGLRISIDGFGTGYSSLDCLRNHQVNRLKIAKKFIDGVPSNSGDVAITRATLGLAREFGIDVVAEGVETAEQAAFLVSLGCKYAQGYYFGRAAPADGATLLLRQGRIDVGAVSPTATCLR
jgi:diguanylate cyclase (GGDEF)-like protein/PAS domain S-box-containing protein